MRVKIFMKSGNVITARGVSEVDYKYRGDEIVGLTLHYNWLRRLFPWLYNVIGMKSVALSQIEAITSTY